MLLFQFEVDLVYIFVILFGIIWLDYIDCDVLFLYIGIYINFV